jgi:hypothetical protein
VKSGRFLLSDLLCQPELKRRGFKPAETATDQGGRTPLLDCSNADPLFAGQTGGSRCQRVCWKGEDSDPLRVPASKSQLVPEFGRARFPRRGRRPQAVIGGDATVNDTRVTTRGSGIDRRRADRRGNGNMVPQWWATRAHPEEVTPLEKEGRRLLRGQSYVAAAVPTRLHSLDTSH